MALKEVAASDGFLVLYECHMSFSDAVALGVEWFSSLGLVPNEMACGHGGSPGGSPTKVKAIKKLAQFDPLIEQRSVDYVVIASMTGKDPSAHVTFYYGHDAATPEFHRLIIAWRKDQLPNFDIQNLIPVVEKLAATAQIPYGFATRLPLSQVTQYEYADAQAVFVPFLVYEAPSKWQTEVPSYLSDSPGPRRYLSGMLRLVYEINVVTNRHLSMAIAGGTLRDWIEADATRGCLESLAAGVWAWHVEATALADINRTCGEAGLLVAWEPPRPAAAPMRRLP